MYSTKYGTQRIVIIALCAFFFSSILNAAGRSFQSDTSMAYTEGVKAYYATITVSQGIILGDETLIQKYDTDGNLREKYYEMTTGIQVFEKFNTKGQRVFYATVDTGEYEDRFRDAVGHYTYNEDERLIQESIVNSIEHEYDMVQFQTNYEYDHNGNISIKKTRHGSVDDYYGETHFFYDSNNILLVESLILPSMPETPINATKYYYDGIIRKLEYPYYALPEGFQDNTESFESFYENTYLPVDEIRIYDQGILKFKTFTYGYQGQLDAENWEEFFDSIDIYEVIYDEKGNHVSITCYKSNYETIFYKYTYEYSNFDERGNWLERKMTWNNETSELLHSITTRTIEYYD